MKKLLYLSILLIVSCKTENKQGTPSEEENNKKPFISSVNVQTILEDDLLSVRAIEVIGNNHAFAGNNGVYGLYNAAEGSWKTNVQQYNGATPEFRAVASTANDFFMLSVGNPALLYKTGENGEMKLVYKEENEKVFYDSLAFWNDREGIAMGDPTDNCLSVIVTRDGGQNWKKLDCDMLPETEEGEAAFAASNSNIAIQGDNTWILSGGMKSRIFYSPDKGKSWEVFETPMVQGKSTTGGYSMDFYNESNGIIIGGDYTSPEGNMGNKAVTTDGGRTWELVGEGEEPGYKSGVRYLPNSEGDEIVAVGFTGISYSKNGGKSWEKLSDEGFYTLRFMNDSTAYAAGKGRIAMLTFK
ncbi:WD40/YVTN/BNR-like repeat-containing protein [Autumnicola edwardsiae]|uniref:Oxidoreductase n=1 Tax=Autumnicola edwardsiae TaxID=3075594 RepID=A0ABU3CTY9_9FLAO|nr:oxidoreductase [Zunongwangia sp. F297]MDT0649819.1 oxidoreductase [Zunongwangia sp. F297]